MPAFKDLTGLRFHRLVAITYENRLCSKGRRGVWLCHCDCGKEVRVLSINLRRGLTKSCGCWRHDFIRGNTTHGRSNTRLYKIWSGIKTRCRTPNASAYPGYGGRGIRICDRWLGPTGFVNFVADMGDRPGPGYSIDRINNDGHYEPGNCRWATAAEQQSNKRDSCTLELGGRSMTVAQWSRETGIPAGLIWDRVFTRHWLPVDALTKRPRPIRKRVRPKSQKPLLSE
jgi:hypothetical protein